MEMTVQQVARRAGISVRTLHYYHQIGLLFPSRITEAGYRLYDEAAVERLGQILFYRELEFPLEQIRAILSDPDYDRTRALQQHRRLLLLKRERLDRLVALVDEQLKGGCTMDLSAFDRREYDALRRTYAQEAQARWGGTQAYRESERRTQDYSSEDWNTIMAQQEALLQALAQQVGQDPASPEVQQLVAQWQAWITDHFYPCTREILAGLGEMYLQDTRFQENLDRFAPGTARLLSQAIAIYCET